NGERSDLMIYDLNALPEGRIHWREFVCEAEAPEQPLPAPGIQFRNQSGGEPQQSVAGGPVTCRQVLLAVETDFEFSSIFHTVEEASAYLTILMGASSELFTAQTGVQFELGFVRLWSNASDPWSGVNTRAQLTQFRDHWNSNMGHVQRHVAHFLSGRNLGGG